MEAALVGGGVACGVVPAHEVASLILPLSRSALRTARQSSLEWKTSVRIGTVLHRDPNRALSAENEIIILGTKTGVRIGTVLH